MKTDRVYEISLVRDAENVFSMVAEKGKKMTRACDVRCVRFIGINEYQ